MKTRFELLSTLRNGWAEAAPAFWTAPGLPAEAVEPEAALMRGSAAGERVAHLGCGDGRLSRAMGPGIVGVDVSPALVQAARAGGLLDARLWAGPPAPLPGSPFDGLVLDAGWLTWPAAELAAVIRAAADALKPEGWLRLPVLLADDAGPPALLLAPTGHAAQQWQRWMTDAGLVLEADLDSGWCDGQRRGPQGPAPGLPEAAETPAVDAELLYAHWMAAADAAFESGAALEAEACLEHATATWPQGREGWMQWTFHRLAQGDLRGAALLTEAWVEARPEDAEGWLRRAEVAEARDKPAEAHAHLAEARRLGLSGHLAQAADGVAAALASPQR
ncbi:MAG: methyltransferase domain-containing protein [Myxococcales bacterium]|nr:methyltransferase domain-containing protein [Myxococcales bacterium]